MYFFEQAPAPGREVAFRGWSGHYLAVGEDGSLTWDRPDTSQQETHIWMEQHQGGVAFLSASKKYLNIDETGSVAWNAITATDTALFNVKHMVQTGKSQSLCIMEAL